MNICAEERLYLPTAECDDCSSLIGRIAALEEKLRDTRRIRHVKTDTDGNRISVLYLGTVEES